MSTTDSAKDIDPDAAMIECLRRPGAYAEKTRGVELIETHISWVFLTDRHAYKLKKPVKFDFLDFSTPELRKAACEEEVHLNRRLASDVYLGVVPLTRKANGPWSVERDGPVVDWLVKMRRLPQDRALDAFIRDRRLSDEDVHRVVDTLAEFYAQLPPLPIRTELYHQRVEAHVRSNRDELLDPVHGFDQSSVCRNHSAQLSFLQLHQDVFDARACDGRIVNGHGDLRPDHVYLLPTPTIIDCIEFSAELRQLDVLDDLSFLAIECEMLGSKSLGEQILDGYFRASGDRPPRALVAFYKSYRAGVRAKVQALRGRQLRGADQAAARKLASDYLRVADRYRLQMAPVWLLVVRGLSGTGKSTLARALGDALGIEPLQTDVIRREMPGSDGDPADFDAGRYAPSHRQQVYDVLFERAAERLRDGQSVILDGTFLSTEQRAQADRLARRHEAVPALLECRCPDELARRRIVDRFSSPGSASSHSEFRPEFLAGQREQEEPDPAGLSAGVVDTTAAFPAMLGQVWQHLRQIELAAALA